MDTFVPLPETPIVEEWLWQTDVQTSNNGTEVRISLADEPRRTLNLKYVFTEEDDIRQARALAFANTDRPFNLPFWQQATALTAPAPIGAQAVALLPARTDLRPGRGALIFDRAGNVEAVTIDAVQAAGVTLAGPLARAWGRGASIVPVWPVYVAGTVTGSRAPRGSGTFGLTATDYDVMVPFVNPANTAELRMFNGLPVCEYNSVGTSFDEAISNGSTVTQYVGLPKMVTNWKHQQLAFSRAFLCNRTFDRQSWEWWRKFADYCRGSWQPFYLPTFREDFQLIGFVDNNTMTLKGAAYVEDFFPFEPFKQFAFLSGAGIHYASVANCVKDADGNSRVSFGPAIPNALMADAIPSLLMKVRIADDKLSCEHTALQTTITMALRTTDQ